MHSSDSGYQRYTNEWEGIRDGEMTPFKGGSGFAAITGHAGRPIIDTISSLIGHGLCTRFPTLRFTPVENGSNWVRPLLGDMEYAYHHSPERLRGEPRRRLQAEHLRAPVPRGGPQGSHRAARVPTACCSARTTRTPRAWSDPITFVDDLKGLPEEDIEKVMGGNLNRLMGFDEAAKAA